MRWKVAGFFAALSLAFLVAQRWPASQALTGPGIIRVTDREIRHLQLDNGQRGLTAGDVEITRSLLFNKRITPKAIGHGELVCTHVTRSLRVCTGTYVLPKGKLVVGGTVLYRQLFQLAVLGGTGLYDNVSGTLTATLLGERPQRESVLVFRLTV
ncbi:MAG: hypothetical protein C4305_06260 [Thermoleophilia bacterium]